jgi:hypothetical protein
LLLLLFIFIYFLLVYLAFAAAEIFFQPIFFPLLQLLAGNPFGNSGGQYLARKIVESGSSLRVRCIHFGLRSTQFC